LQARVRSASRSANGNELTLARERRAKQSCAFLWSLAFVRGLALASGILRDFAYHHPIGKAGLMTSELTNCPAGGDPAAETHLCAIGAADPSSVVVPAMASPETPTSEADLDLSADPESWRDEVAARLQRYRTRRKPRTPRYPSLLLPFDAPESWSRSSSAATSLATTTNRSAAVAAAARPTRDAFEEHASVAEASIAAEFYPASGRISEPDPYQYANQAPEPSAKVIEFPRSAAIPVSSGSELAEPVFDRPRIVEAPEILPPPPALGGMLIEPAQQETADRRDGADFFSAFPSASILRRALAALMDGAVLATALTAFAAIFLRLNPSLNPSLNPIREPRPMLAVVLALLALLLWMAYEFLFVVYTGSTPGLRIARLRLARFDGSPLNRGLRRWRVLASFLSAFSAGLGYLWCLLDQDGLCWHDRITRTHVQPATLPE
jgi:uncharacterized RDD family membrane protein YckC